MRSAPVLLLVAAAGLATAAAAAVAQDAAPPVKLEPLEIGPREDPLWADREHLRKLVDAQPCLGCGTPVRQTLAETLVDIVLGRSQPPNPDFETRRETRVTEDWRIPERGPGMEAFR